MCEIEGKLNSCLFGGYEKRSTEAYIEELRATIAKQEKDLQTSSGMNEEYSKKIDDVETRCEAILEQNQKQAEVIQQLKNKLEMSERVIEVQKEKTRARSEVVRRQEELLAKRDEELKLSQEKLSELKDRQQQDGEQMLELELKLSQKVQALKEQEKLIAGLKDQIEKLQYMYEEAQQNRGRFSVPKLEQLVQEGMKIINGWKQ